MSASDRVQERSSRGRPPSGPSAATKQLEAAANTAGISPAALIRQAIQRQAAAFKAVLPATTDPERYARLMLTAVKATPQLMECFGTRKGETSLLLAGMQAAAINLEPNTKTEECWLLPRRDHGVMTCQLSIGYRGYIKLSRRSGNIGTVYSQVVHEADEFDYGVEIGNGHDGDYLVWKPADVDDPGEATHVFCFVRFLDGGHQWMVLTRREVEARRAHADSWKNDVSNNTRYSPWHNHKDAMWRKSSVRAIFPYLDASSQMAAAVAADEADVRIVKAGPDESGFELDSIPFALDPGEDEGAPPVFVQPTGQEQTGDAGAAAEGDGGGGDGTESVPLMPPPPEPVLVTTATETATESAGEAEDLERPFDPPAEPPAAAAALPEEAAAVAADPEPVQQSLPEASGSEPEPEPQPAAPPPARPAGRVLKPVGPDGFCGECKLVGKHSDGCPNI